MSTRKSLPMIAIRKIVRTVHKHAIVIVICSAAYLSAHSVRGDLMTSPSGVPASASSIDFSQFFSAGRTRIQTGDPPIEVDEFVSETVYVRPVYGTSIVGSILGVHGVVHPDNNYYLGVNGYWGPGREGFLGIGGGNGSRVALRIEFADGPVAAVGGLFNYPPDSRWFPVVISALDQNLSVLEQYSIDVVAPISTPSKLDVGEFRGISRPQDDIFALEISAPFAVIDDIRFARVVPEPSTLVLVVLLALNAARLRAGN